MISKYIIPNAITSGGLFLGLLSIFSSMEGDLSGAAWLILLCVIIDKCDGIAARLLSADSKFGVEMDSFSDFVTFGIAPGVLYLSLFNDRYESMSFLFFASHIAVVVYVLCSSYRLARFNSVSSEKTNFFIGFPTTFCGGVTSSFFLTMGKYGLDSVIPYLPAALIFLAFLMVSNFRVPKVKPYKNRVYNIFQAALFAAVFMATILRSYPEFLFSAGILYTLSGVFMNVKCRLDASGEEGLQPR